MKPDTTGKIIDLLEDVREHVSYIAAYAGRTDKQANTIAKEIIKEICDKLKLSAAIRGAVEPEEST